MNVYEKFCAKGEMSVYEKFCAKMDTPEFARAKLYYYAAEHLAQEQYANSVWKQARREVVMELIEKYREEMEDELPLRRKVVEFEVEAIVYKLENSEEKAKGFGKWKEEGK